MSATGRWGNKDDDAEAPSRLGRRWINKREMFVLSSGITVRREDCFFVCLVFLFSLITEAFMLTQWRDFIRLEPLLPHWLVHWLGTDAVISFTLIRNWWVCQGWLRTHVQAHTHIHIYAITYPLAIHLKFTLWSQTTKVHYLCLIDLNVIKKISV